MPKGLVETRNIDVSTNISSGVINVTSPFSEAPNSQSVWLIRTNDIQSQQFRVISVKEEDNGITGVSCLAYNESIYNAIEQDLKLEQRDITNLTDPLTRLPTLLIPSFISVEIMSWLVLI